MTARLKRHDRIERLPGKNDGFFLRCICIIALAAGLSSCSCSNSTERPAGVANKNSGTEDSNAASPGNSKARLKISEPDNYVCDVTIVLTEGSSMRFQLAKIGADRRAAFQLPANNEVIYLEHSGLRYLIFPLRRQYVEVPLTLGVDLSGLINPAAFVGRLRARSDYESLGAEVVAGRTGNKFRFTGSTKAIAHIDDFSGIPLRLEVEGSHIVELTNVRTTPDSSTFDVPLGFKKVRVSEVKQQVDALVGSVSPFAAAANGRQK